MDLAPREVCLFLPPTAGYFADVALGVQEFVRGPVRWSIEVCPNLEAARNTTRVYRPAGVILGGLGREWQAAVRRLKVPFVEVGGRTGGTAPSVGTDNLAIGKMAADHLRDLGFKHFAFCGYRGADWSDTRERGYREALAVPSDRYFAYRGGDGEIFVGAVTKSLAKWIRELPRPIAIFACHDRVAMLLANACTYVRARVPDDVALLGVDDSALECGFATPPLSSIMGSARRVGYEAAAVLEKMMGGGVPPAGPITVPPAGVSVRQSTNVLALPDGDVVAALQFITRRSDEPIEVSDVAEAVLVSRRMLERKFQAFLGRSPRAEILRAHLARAKSLLVGTDRQVIDVALASGFPSACKFSAVFRRETGTSPSVYRRLYGTRTSKPAAFATAPAPNQAVGDTTVERGARASMSR